MSRPSKAVALKRLNALLGRVPPLKEGSGRSVVFEAQEWGRDARVAVANIFGSDSPHVSEFERPSYALLQAEPMLRSMIKEIQEYWEDQTDQVIDIQENQVLQDTRKVFLVHGHDEGAKDGAARFLEKLGLETIVLAEMPSEGNTIIEKFEKHADVGYAIVLLTGDDRGARQGEKPVPRARQNVIFELGYFIGKLGRRRVCALTKDDPEIPSDYSGVVYIPMEDNSWTMSLIKELKAARLDIDANKAFD